jgi:putative Mg2+ transporter-C (MgtC) family protein
MGDAEWWRLQAEMLARLLVASALGAAVGFERQRADKPAQTRDHLLVALGAAAFTVASIFGFGPGDPGRVAAQIVTGIGFLGAGVIIRQGSTIVGVTTAASIWVAAAIGLAVGAGLYVVGVFAALLSVLALRLRHRTEG